MKTNIPMFFAIDDNYVNYFLVTIESLKDRASREYNYTMYILYTSLSSKSKKMIKRYEDKNFKAEFIDMTDAINKVSDKLCTRDYYTKTTYFRLFVADMFPEIDKALYLDSDICVLKDISELYETELNDNYVAAAPDQSVQEINEFRIYVENCLGLNYKEYFNAGILVLNFKKMREDNFENQVLNLLSSYEFKVAQDQDILNVICAHKTVLLDSFWNQMPFGKRNNNASIIHYNLIFKPWKMNDVMYEEYFWKYAVKSKRALEILDAKSDMIFDDISSFESIMEGLKGMCLSEANSSDNYYHLVCAR